MVKIVVVNKGGDCVETDFKNFDETELFKKCQFRKSDGFEKQHSWSIKCDGSKHNISVYARIAGKHNIINKFEFPPPVDTTLFYGNCALVNRNLDNEVCDLDIELWNKIYTKLFGGFENLDDTAEQDEKEVDELENVPAKYKTKEGFLKDGFVVDNDSDDIVGENNTETESEMDSNEDDTDETDVNEDEFDDNGSELAPDDYLSSSDEE